MIHALYSYLMTRILHDLGVEFREKLARASDLDDVCELHMWYVTTVKERCLLSDRASTVKNAIAKLIGVALRFRQKWDSTLVFGAQSNASVTAGSTVQFSDIETDFNRCCQFLSSMMANLLKNGSYTHRECPPPPHTPPQNMRAREVDLRQKVLDSLIHRSTRC